jgi:succinyl-diaminopimelate desuccinylase
VAVDLLVRTAELVAIASESHQERAITDHLEGVLRARAPWLRLDRHGDNLVARTALGRPMRAVLAGHTDTVPANGNFPGRIEGDVLHGVGSSDMKAGLAVMLELACTLRDPAVDVTFVFYEAEEVAARFNGLGTLFAERPDLLAGDVALLGEPTDAMLEAGCQGTMRAEITFAGARAHTARPWMGRNAVHRLAGVLGRLAAYEGRRPVIDGCEFREAMQAVRVEGGVAGNVVPDRAVLTVNHRFAPDRTVDEAEAHLREVTATDLGDGDRFEIVDSSPAAAPALTHPLLSALVSRNDLEVRAKLGWTDVARFAAHGIPAANFGPGDATIAHTAGEYVRREPIERCYEALARLLTDGA